MKTRHRAPLRRPGRHHRPTRRVPAADVQAWVLGIPEPVRLEEYRERWGTLLRTIEPCREGLGRRVDELARAFRVVLGKPIEMTRDMREQHILRLGLGAVARYWRRRPCPAWGGRVLPRIVGGPYFGAPPDSVHVLDLDVGLVIEALKRELQDLDNHTRPGRYRSITEDCERHRLDLLLLTDELRDQLVQDAVVTVASPLYRRVFARLTELEWKGPSPGMRRFAAQQLDLLASAARPDFRSDRTHRRHRLTERSREERTRAASRSQDIRGHQETFRGFCAEQTEEDPESVPPALRTAYTDIEP